MTGLPVIAVGSVGVDTQFGAGGTPLETPAAQRLQVLAEQFRSGDFDLVALGRALLADPAWVAKALGGRVDEIVPYESGQHRRPTAR